MTAWELILTVRELNMTAWESSVTVWELILTVRELNMTDWE